MIRFCLSLFGSTDQICDAIRKNPEADLYEIRLDLAPPIDGQQIRNATLKPLIFTAHGKPELLHKFEQFADYIDVEQHPEASDKRIVSIHEMEADPDRLWERLQGDHLTKIVLETADYGKMLTLLRLNRIHPGKAICFASGEIGAFTRVLSTFWGACWMYACVDHSLTGPGQFSLRELQDVYRIRRFTEAPHVFGIIGDPVSHSASPAFHNRRFAEENLSWIYLPFRCADVKALMAFAPEFGVCGFSVTHPHKEAVLDLLDISSPAVRQLGCCNTLFYQSGRWYGTNTDVEGVTALIRDAALPFQGSTAVVVGAGGAARAIVSVIRPLVRKLIILNRSKDRAEALAADFNAEAGTLGDLRRIQFDVLFQATSIGWKDGESPIDPEILHKGVIVVDAVYKPEKTLLMHRALALGGRAVNGKIWFETQAEAQFQWWKHNMDHKAALRRNSKKPGDSPE